MANWPRISTRIDRGFCSPTKGGFPLCDKAPQTLDEFSADGATAISLGSSPIFYLPGTVAIPVKLLTDLVFEVADDGVFICSRKYFFDDRFWRSASP